MDLQTVLLTIMLPCLILPLSNELTLQWCLHVRPELGTVGSTEELAQYEASILLTWPCRWDMALELTALAASSWSQLVPMVVYSRRTVASLFPDCSQGDMILEPEPRRLDSWFTTFSIIVKISCPFSGQSMLLWESFLEVQPRIFSYTLCADFFST